MRAFYLTRGLDCALSFSVAIWKKEWQSLIFNPDDTALTIQP